MKEKAVEIASVTAERPLVSVAQAAELAGLSKSVAYRLAAAGVLPGLVRLPGARLLVRRRVLEAWLAGDEGAATIDAPPSIAARPAGARGAAPAGGGIPFLASRQRER